MAGLGGQGRADGRGRYIRTGAAGGIAVLLSAPFVLADAGQIGGQFASQGGTQTPPPRLAFDLSSGLTYNDNPDLLVTGAKAQTTLDTGLGLDFNSTSKISSLALSLGIVGRIASDNSGGFRDPSVNLAYKLDTGQTRFDLTGIYNRAPVDLFTPTTLANGTVAGTDVSAVTGDITTQSLAFDAATGVTGPLGFTLAGRYDGHLYSDTTDPGVFDNYDRSISAGAIWRLAPGTEVTLGADAGGTDYSNSTLTRQRNQDVTLGYSQMVRQDLKLQATVGQATATASQLGVETERSSGLIGSLGATQTLANGTASATLDSSRDALGARQTLSFGRDMTLRTGSLSATVGLSARPGETPEVVGRLSYAHTLPTDSVNVSLSRQVALNSDNIDEASAVLDLGWQHKINPVSSLGLSLDLASTTGTGNGFVDDARRTSLSATWTHDLTRDWELTAGYQYRSLDQTSTGLANSNSVFLTVHRKFVLLP